MNPINLADYEALARERLTETAWDRHRLIVQRALKQQGGRACPT